MQNSVPAAPFDRGHAAALAACLIWALVPVGTRYFVLRVDPDIFNFIRFAASGGVALPLFFRASPWRWPARDRWLLGGCAVLAIPGYNLPISLAARSVPAGALGLLIATEPVMIVMLAALFQRRPVQRRVIVGSMLALCGVALTSGVAGSPLRLGWWSTGQVLFGAFAWSAYTVLGVRLNRRYGAFDVTGCVLVVGSSMLLAISVPGVHAGQFPGQTTVLMLAGMGLASSLLGFLLWNYAAPRVPSEKLGLYLYLLPVVSVGAGIELLAESITAQILMGGALTLLGVYIASRPARPPATVAVA